MIGGNVQLPAPRLPDRIARAVRLLMQLPPEQQRLVVDTIEAFAKTAGLADAEHKQERAG